MTYNYQLEPHEFVDTNSEKKQIYLHHTAGTGTAQQVAKYWNNDKRGRIATSIIIDQAGDTCICFPTSKWSYHLGLKKSVFTSKGLPYLNLDKMSIGIELVAWGWLRKVDGAYVTYVGTEVPEEEVTVLKTHFRGHKYYHSYSELQLKSLRAVLNSLSAKHNIDITYHHDQMWEVNKKALQGMEGLYTHCSVREDKTDVFPQPELIEMLKSKPLELS